MLWWPAALCQLLADGGLRDTGQSSTYPPGQPVDDAFSVLDSYGVRHAHFAGMSLGRDDRAVNRVEPAAVRIDHYANDVEHLWPAHSSVAGL
jgi:hypothetical protein